MTTTYFAIPVSPCCMQCGEAIIDPELGESICASGDPCEVSAGDLAMWRCELEAIGYFDNPICPGGETWEQSDGPWLPVEVRLERRIFYRAELAMQLADVRARRAMRRYGYEVL